MPLSIFKQLIRYVIAFVASVLGHPKTKQLTPLRVYAVLKAGGS